MTLVQREEPVGLAGLKPGLFWLLLWLVFRLRTCFLDLHDLASLLERVNGHQQKFPF
ncbi:hypothetical protein K458DRAFT_74054 [Lentithecium fluviatile CBS 122367]|uniref:Uncharacterized protein n=1 Tax=Lentithecium fluviatile CBS 122367 TaxID=1168545 RepID=A0A6G1IVK7_9PLEO|nr:hypothetical protein K458DRAFT_74054 [Lentithecium fluviatile CBS 122367]